MEEKLTLSTIKKRLDQLLKVVRYFDSEDGETNCCITCRKKFPIKELQCGHFIKRGNLFLKYYNKNLARQCARCNRFLDGAQDKFAYYIITKYGLDDFKYLVEKDYEWLDGKIATPKRKDYVDYYNYWLRENRRVEKQFNIKIIPTSWKETL